MIQQEGTLTSDTVNIGASWSLISITPQVIWTKRIDINQQNVHEMYSPLFALTLANVLSHSATQLSNRIDESFRRMDRSGCVREKSCAPEAFGLRRQ